MDKYINFENISEEEFELLCDEKFKYYREIMQLLKNKQNLDNIELKGQNTNARSD